MRQRGDKNFIDILSKVRVENVDSELETIPKSRIICSSDPHYPKYALYVVAENVPIFTYSKVMLDQINGMPITIDAIDSIPIGCALDSEIMVARNRSISQTGGLSKSLTLKTGIKIILTTNTIHKVKG